ncbi:MAG: hypothetical protein P8L83_05480 [Flavobacteriaceae bacterium]|nr:hypothetical protein [Flavobacteriaceae bacterium]
MNKTSEYYQDFKKKLEVLRKEVQHVRKGKFIAYLVALFLLPGGSILCIIALYIRLLKNN